MVSPRSFYTKADYSQFIVILGTTRKEEKGLPVTVASLNVSNGENTLIYSMSKNRKNKKRSYSSQRKLDELPAEEKSEKIRKLDSAIFNSAPMKEAVIVKKLTTHKDEALSR